jgi:hypothetical protein
MRQQHSPFLIRKFKMDKYKEEKEKRARIIEQTCRELCKQDGIDPDSLICLQMPQFINSYRVGYIIPSSDFQMIAWWSYRRIVDETLRQIDKQCPQN